MAEAWVPRIRSEDCQVHLAESLTEPKSSVLRAVGASQQAPRGLSALPEGALGALLTWPPDHGSSVGNTITQMETYNRGRDEDSVHWLT